MAETKSLEECERRIAQLEYQMRQLQNGFGTPGWNAGGFPIDYTVAWTAATTNPTLGNGTLVGRYWLRGRLCLVHISLTLGSTTTTGTGDWRFSLPFKITLTGSRIFLGMAALRDSGVNNYERLVKASYAFPSDLRIFSQLDNATNVGNLNSTTPWTWGSGDSLNAQVEYEIE